LTLEQLEQAQKIQEKSSLGINPAARMARSANNGLLLIYPISRFSGHEQKPKGGRQAIYDNPHDPLCKDVIGLAISFPPSENNQGARGEYMIGTVDWNPL
jgi:hypothetical protein